MELAEKPKIQIEWSLSKVIKHYPALLDTLIEFNPEFDRFRNPLLRRVQAKLITVEEAAESTGVEPESLLAKLNEAAGFEVEPVPIRPVAGTDSETPAWVERTKIAEKLDVRPLIARGEDPFNMISGAARRIPVGEALSLRTPFNPASLRKTLKTLGFIAHTHSAGDDWITVFRRVYGSNV